MLQLGSAPYTTYAAVDATATGTAQRVEKTFTVPDDNPNAQLIFQVGGSAQAQTICLDDVSLRGGEPPAPYEPDTGPRVRVNQVGYLPGGPKNATVVTEATAPLPWKLRSAAGAVLASGTTTTRGVDAASGQNVQTVDFSSYRTPGSGLTLTVDGETSHPFDISGTLYDRLRADSLQFFYAQRSGIAIDGDLIGDEYARPAGHLGVAPNKGDTNVPCQPGVCDYSLDVRGGWYDAGDHGKYVVNGGIATYQLLNTFERTKTAATADGGAGLADGSLRVPERGNGVPDILDEARWELEFLLRMQVPAGKPLAGMVHHKIHDQNWTGLPLAPQDDPQPRELHPPSTAATLNLAATAAQCARLFALRRGVRRALRHCREDGLRRRQGPSRGVRQPQRRHRRRRVRRRQRHRRVLLGGSRAVPQHRGADLPDRPERLAAPHRRRVRPAGLRLAERRGARPPRPGHRAERSAGSRADLGPRLGHRRRRRVPGRAAPAGVRAADAR